ncbi:unnamed protein product, partial [Effrenium voratum]
APKPCRRLLSSAPVPCGFHQKVLEEAAAAPGQGVERVAAAWAVEVPELCFFDSAEEAWRQAFLHLAPRLGLVALPAPAWPWQGACAASEAAMARYFLEETRRWDVNLEELEGALGAPSQGGVLVVNNPGVSGHLLPLGTLRKLLKLAARHRLAVFTEEDPVFLHGPPVRSCRDLVKELNLDVPVVSIFSGKDLSGAGTVLHCHNVDSQALKRLQSSPDRAPDVDGQALACALLSRAFRVDDARTELQAQLSLRAAQVVARLTEAKGISCEPIDAGLHVFPKVIIKGYIMKKAISLATPADDVYCTELLERTGVLTAPGCSFGQRPGNFHLRIPLEEISVEELHCNEFLEALRLILSPMAGASVGSYGRSEINMTQVLQYCIKMADTDRNGTLDSEEFELFLRRLRRPKRPMDGTCADKPQELASLYLAMFDADPELRADLGL